MLQGALLGGALLGTWIQLKVAVTLDPSDYQYCKLKLTQACIHGAVVLFLYIFSKAEHFISETRNMGQSPT